MAINRATRYPGRFDAPNAGQPEGAFKNKTGPGAVDGSYLEKDWANDMSAFFSSLLAGDAASGTVDEVGASQYFDSLLNLIVPVGIVIYRDDNTDPVAHYPGTTWARIASGRYIVSEGAHTDTAGTPKTISAGNIAEGTYLHQLTEEEMPAHAHPSGSNQDVSGGGDDARKPDGGGGLGGAVGGNAPHNNMPPGYALFAWKRTG